MTDSLRCETLTRLWLFARYAYRVGDRALWMPISYRVVGWLLLVGGPVWLVLGVLGVPFVGPGLTGYFVVPVLGVWLAVRYVSDGALPREVLWSWWRWVVRWRPVGAVGGRVSGRVVSPVASGFVRVRVR